MLFDRKPAWPDAAAHGTENVQFAVELHCLCIGEDVKAAVLAVAAPPVAVPELQT